MLRNFFLILIFTPVVSNAQSLRFNFFDHSAFERAENGNYNWYWGAGYEHNIGDMIAVSFDYNAGLDFDDNHYGTLFFGDQVSGGQIEYELNLPWKEIAYQSKYFFTGNDDNSFYISSGISYRWIKYQLDVNGVDFTGAYVGQIIPTTIEKTITQFPLSLKLGFRNSIDGWFGDYSLGASFIRGATSQGSGIPIFDDHLENSVFKDFSINFSVAFGIGWAE
jgi:hypothetical protein